MQVYITPRIIPLALSVHFVFTESDVLKLVLAMACSGVSSDVVVRVPPIEIRDHQGCGCARIDRSVVTLSLDTLLGSRRLLLVVIFFLLVVLLLIVVVLLLVMLFLVVVRMTVGSVVVLSVSVLVILRRIAVDVDLEFLLSHGDVVIW